MIDVLSLATEDTHMHKASVREQAGPCPDTQCRCQTDGFRVRWNGKKWVFMCRGCWDSEEFLTAGRKRGWGDEIDYLRHYRKMRYQDARTFLSEQGNDETPARGLVKPTSPDYHDEQWQQKMHGIMKELTSTLWSVDDTTGLDYARSRGFTDETIQKARLAYSRTRDIPRLIVPSVNEGQYVAIFRRDLRPDVPSDERWKDVQGGTKSELYLADCLVRKMPTVLCEDAFSALSVVQEAGDLVNVVATCGAKCGKQAKWLARLARMPLILVALDADQAGDENAQWWVQRLPNARRLRPLLKDVNDMLMAGWDVREWIQNAMPSTEVVPAPPAQEPSGEDEIIELPTTCSTCGSDDPWQFNEDCSQAWCLPCWQAKQEQRERHPSMTADEFTALAKSLVEPVFGPCTVQVFPAGSTPSLADIMAQEQEQEQEQIRAARLAAEERKRARILAR